MLSRILLFLATICLAIPSHSESSKPLTIGSKRFTENYVLAEIFAQLLEDRGFKVVRRPGLGGTMVAFNALKAGEIDIYPEYTGTIAEGVLKSGERDFKKINRALKGSKCGNAQAHWF